MKLGTREHEELMAFFEGQNRISPSGREDKQMWPKGWLYKNGDVNARFIAFREGYAFGKARERMAGDA